MTDRPTLPRTASEQPGYRPILSGAHLEALHRYGTEQPVAVGDVLFRDGDETYDLIVLLEGEGRILRIAVEQVHAIIGQELELSELILREFLVRHSRLTRLGSGLTLVGSRFDIDTRRLLEVLSRNRLSFRWLDLEGEPEAEALLRRLNIPLADLPIVVVPGGDLLRNPSSRALLDALGLALPPPD